MPFFFEAAILSRIRSPVTSRSNWADVDGYRRKIESLPWELSGAEARSIASNFYREEHDRITKENLSRMVSEDKRYELSQAAARGENYRSFNAGGLSDAKVA